jgi:hypothetical protein
MNRQILPTTDFYSQMSQLQTARMEQTRALHAYNMGTTDSNNTFINPEIATAIVKTPILPTVNTNRKFVPKQPIHRTADGNGALYDIRNNSISDAQKSIMQERVRDLAQRHARDGYVFHEDDRMASVVSQPHDYEKHLDYNARHRLREAYKQSEHLKEQRKRQLDAYKAGTGKNRGETRYDATIHTERINHPVHTPKYSTDNITIADLHRDDSIYDRSAEPIHDDTVLKYDARMPINSLVALTKYADRTTNTAVLSSKPTNRNQNAFVAHDNHVVFAADTPRERFSATPTTNIIRDVNDSVDRAAEQKLIKRVNDRYVADSDRKRSMQDNANHFMLPTREYYESDKSYSLFDRVADVITGFFKQNTVKQNNNAERYRIDRDAKQIQSVQKVNVQRGLVSDDVQTSRNVERYNNQTLNTKMRLYNDKLRRDYMNNNQQIVQTIIETGAVGTALEGYDIFHSLIYDKETGGYTLAQTMYKRDRLTNRNKQFTNEFEEGLSENVIVNAVSLTDDLVNELALKSNIDPNRFKRITQENNKMLDDNEIARRMLQNIITYVDMEQEYDARVQPKRMVGTYNRHVVKQSEVRDDRKKHIERPINDVISMEAKTQRQQMKPKSMTRNDIVPHDISNNKIEIAQYNNVIFGSR